MKCQSCGGPVSETAGRGRVHCGYCGTINVLSDVDSSLDRIVATDQFGEHGCPTCGVQMLLAFADDCKVEFCSECQGVLFERETFARIVTARRSAYRGADETPIPVNQAELKERRNCPACHQIMDCHSYYGPGNSVIDSCHRCSLVWLDAGELTTLERASGRRTPVGNINS